MCYYLKMFFITVIPVSKNTNLKELSYFSTNQFDIGSLVLCTLGEREIQGIIVKKDNVINLKTEIKSADFKLKKIKKEIQKDFINKKLIDFLNVFCTENNFEIGDFLAYFLNKNTIENFCEKTENTKAQKYLEKNEKINLIGIEGNIDFRISEIKKLINRNQTIRENKIVVYILPRKEFIKKLKNKKDFEEAEIFEINSSTKNLTEQIQKINSSDINQQDIVIFATPNYFLYLQNNLKKIDFTILDLESDIGYKNILYPFIDSRLVIIELCKYLNINLILSDIFLRQEVIFQIDELKSSINNENIVTFDRAKKSIFSQSLYKKLEQYYEKGKKVFIYSPSAGFSSAIICNTCKNILHCENCNGILNTIKRGEEGLYRCKQCHTEFPISSPCSICQSIQVSDLGISTGSMQDAIKQFAKEKDILIYSSLENKSAKEIKKIKEKMSGENGLILIGTEMIIPYLDEKFDLVILSDISHLYLSYDFRSYDKLRKNIYTLYSLSKKYLFIQKEKDQIIEKILINSINKKDRLNEIENEFSPREDFDFPPFGAICKISYPINKQNYIQFKNFIDNIKNSRVIYRKAYKEKKIQKEFTIISFKKENQNKILETLKNQTITGEIVMEFNPERLFNK